MIDFNQAFTQEFCSDLMTHRTKQVIEKLKTSGVKLTRRFLYWVQQHEEDWGQNHKKLLKEVYLFIKYNYWDSDCLDRIDLLNKRILKLQPAYETSDASKKDFERVRNLIGCGDKVKELEEALDNFSESQKIEFFRMDANGNTPFTSCLNYESLLVLEKYCPATLRMKMFSRNAEGDSLFLKSLLLNDRSTDLILDFIVSRFPESEFMKLFKKDAKSNLRIQLICIQNRAELLKIALKCCPADIIEEQLYDKEKNSLLSLCAEPQTAQVLLENIPSSIKSKLFAANDNGWTPLHVCVNRDNLSVDWIELILKHCPKPLLSSLYAKTTAADTPFDLGNTPFDLLRLRHDNKSPEMLEALLKGCPEELKLVAQ